MQKEKLVSVVIPTYNREKTILRSINSVLNQTYTNLECIVVDDCSTDDTQELVNGIQDKRLKYIKCAVNIGPAKARNIGIHASNGNYITFNDSDCYWNRNKLQKQINYLWEHPEYGMVYCRFMYKGPKSDKILPVTVREKTDLEGCIYKKLLYINLIDTSAMLIRKEVLDEVGNFSEHIKSIEDYELALRIAYKYKVGFIDEVLFENVCSPNSVNADKKNKMDAFIYLLQQHWDKVEIDGKYGLMSSFLKLVAELYDSLEQDVIMKKLYSNVRLSCEEKRVVKMMLNSFTTEIYKVDVLKKILLLKNNLNKYKNKSILIYGYGEIGQILADLFEGAGIQIKGFIDRNSIWDKKYQIFHLDALPDGIDLIINTLPECKLQKKEIAKNTSATVISVLELS